MGARSNRGYGDRADDSSWTFGGAFGGEMKEETCLMLQIKKKETYEGGRITGAHF